MSSCPSISDTNFNLPLKWDTYIFMWYYCIAFIESAIKTILTIK